MLRINAGSAPTAGADVLSEPRRWCLVLLLKGFEHDEARSLSFIRWLVERGVLGGASDGADPAIGTPQWCKVDRVRGRVRVSRRYAGRKRAV